MKKGITQGVMPAMTIRKTCALAQKAGFSGIELDMWEKEKELVIDTPETKLKEFKMICSDYGLEIPSLACPLLWGYTFTHNDIEVRRKAILIVERTINAAALLGADTILIIPGVVKADTDYTDAYQRAQESIEKLGRLAKASNISLGLENGGMKFLATPLEFDRFLGEINNDSVGVYFDTGNAMIEGYPEHWLRILGPRLKKIHLKDFRASARTFPEAYTSLFQGDINWKEVMKEIRHAGYNDYLIAEFPRPKYYAEEALVRYAQDIDLLLSLEDKP